MGGAGGGAFPVNYRFDWTNWTPKDKAVLVLLWNQDRDEVLLIHKKRGLGQGKVNFPGGRLENQEGWKEAAIRETNEEVGLWVDGLVECAQHQFQFVDGYGLLVKAFLTNQWAGKLVSTPEAEPFWCARAEIPFTRMWGDDPIWVPRVFEGFYVRARWLFDGDRMLGSQVEWEWPSS